MNRKNGFGLKYYSRNLYLENADRTKQELLCQVMITVAMPMEE